MNTKLAVMVALSLPGCSEALPPIPETERAEFRAAFAAARQGMASLRSCRDTKQAPFDAVRQVEVREARLSFLASDAARHRLARDVGQVEEEEATRVASCAYGFDQARQHFDNNAVKTLDAIERVEKFYGPESG